MTTYFLNAAGYKWFSIEERNKSFSAKTSSTANNKFAELNYYDQKMRRTLTHDIQKDWTAVPTLLGLISSAYRDLHQCMRYELAAQL